MFDIESLVCRGSLVQPLDQRRDLDPRAFRQAYDERVERLMGKIATLTAPNRTLKLLHSPSKKPPFLVRCPKQPLAQPQRKSGSRPFCWKTACCSRRKWRS